MNSEELKKKAIFLSWFTVIYNVIEGIIAIGFGYNDDSLSLMGFGFDSFVESASALVVLWRLRGEMDATSHLSVHREKTSTFAIGILFFVLATGTSIGSILQLMSHGHPKTTLPGLIVSLVSLSFMFYLVHSKRKVGNALSSATILKDADCSMACIKVSVVLFAGSILFLLIPALWWIDATAGLLLALLIFKEGWETIQSIKKKAGGCGCSD